MNRSASLAIALIKTQNYFRLDWGGCARLQQFVALCPDCPRYAGPNKIASKRRSTNCAVKAFVDATPTSVPACNIKEKSLSLTIDEVATLQKVRVAKKPDSFALRKAARVSAVSPDWERVIKSEFFRPSDLPIPKFTGNFYLTGYIC